MGLTIHAAEIAMIDELTDLAIKSKAFWGYPPDFIDACKNELSVSKVKFEDSRYQYFVAQNSGVLLGFYCLETLNEDDVELEALFVSPESIGRGIGRVLIEHAKQNALDQGFSTMAIQGDPHASRFYEAAGAELVGEKESGSIPGRMLPMFKIELRGS